MKFDEIGDAKVWIKLGIENILGIRAHTIYNEEMGYRCDVFILDLLLLQLQVCQTWGEDIQIMIDLGIVKFSFIFQLGRFAR